MKFIFTLLASLLICSNSFGQCSTVGIQIANSDTTLIQLYHAGLFNIPSGFANVCQWEVTTLSGDLVFEATTSGATVTEQSLVIFVHSVPLTDSMKATLVITNDIEGIVCTITDTIIWEESEEILPGVFQGSWVVLNGNVGIEEPIAAINEIDFYSNQIEIFPTPANEYFTIKTCKGLDAISIIDINGKILKQENTIRENDTITISELGIGIYFIQFWDAQNQLVGNKKLIKY